MPCIYFFVTGSKKSLSSIALIRLAAEEAFACSCCRQLIGFDVFDSLEFDLFLGLDLVCCLVTPSHSAAKNGARSSNEKIAVIVS